MDSITIPKKVFQDVSLSPNTRLLFGMISTGCNETKDGSCTIKNSDLAAILQVTEESVVKMLARLKTSGYISTYMSDNRRHIRVFNFN